MCGLAGIYDLRKENRIDRDALERMTTALVHRGPDQFGYQFRDNVGFGFSRLSIIDLAGGMQPMTDDSTNFLSMCNGEIFNHLDLREHLRGRGHQFRTGCDAEVVPHLYREYGTDFFDRLNGQFALVVHDPNEDRLVAARDQVGICPFFYTVTDGLFIFASEIKAILQHPKVTKELDLVGLDQVFSFPGLVSPRTMFCGISSLKPGHYLTISADQGVKMEEYWDLKYPKQGSEPAERTEAEYIEEFDELFSRAVERRLLADVPVGVYLSGGLDSSLVLAKMRRLRRDQGISSFSITFEDKLISEGKYQRYLSKCFKTKHHEKLCPNAEIIPKLRKTVYHTESVLKETFNTASLTLSSLTHGEDIRVVLAGQGADELFAGYVGYRFDAYRDQSKQDDASPEERALRQKLWADEGFMYEKQYLNFENTKSALYSERARQAFPQSSCLNHFLVNRERMDNINFGQKRSYLDVKLRLADHLLSGHGDRMAMAHSVETRYPFLDPDILDFAARLPQSMKLNQFREKYILRKIGEACLPKAILNRDKFEFTAPGSPFLLNQNDEYINHLLSFETIKKGGVFDPHEVERLVKRYREPGFRIHMPFDSDLLIIAITLGIFQDVFDMPGL